MVALSAAACGDHYEGGGRRDQVPTEETAEGSGVGLGDGMSTQGGTSSIGGTSATVGGASGAGGTIPFPFPFGGSAGTGGTGG